MNELSNAKSLGVVGALLSLIGIFLPSFGIFLALVGFILILVAVKNISEVTKDKTIFNNFLYAFILEIIAFVVALIIVLFVFQSVGGISYFTELQNMAYTNPGEIIDYLMPFILGALAAFIILCFIMIISAIFYKKCFDKIGEKTNVKWFSTTGLLFLIGAATLIIIIGFFILIIALIFQIIAFFSLPETLPKK